MRSFLTYLTLGAASLQGVLGLPTEPLVKKDGVDDFIATEEPIAISRLLCNIGSTGCEAGDVPPGVVLASPSRSDPDYFYTWTRDAALVFKALIERFKASDYDDSLQGLIHDYISSQAKLQGVSNPSGSLVDGAGLGEAKYNADLSAFTGAWGRPQRDGPALRAIAIIQYAKWLVENGYGQTAVDVAWPVIRNDLAYVAQYWNYDGFDLWEEVSGASFFTTSSQYRALVEGSALAQQLGGSCPSCDSIAPQILCFLQGYWSDSLSGGAVVSNIRTNNGRAGLDANSILASIHSFDPSLGCDPSTFQPCSDKALSNFKAVTDSFRSWGINSGIGQGQALAVGRYIEDVYYGGNPWYLNTLAAAEHIYDALNVWEAQGVISVTDISLGFFRDFDSSVSTGTYAAGTSTYQNLISKISAYADGYVIIVDQYTPADGRMAEQYNKQNGVPLGARDLTWSYASFLTAVAARRRLQSSTFGWANGVASPNTCGTSSVLGAYFTATATIFPDNMAPGSGNEPDPTLLPTPTPTTCLISVTFNQRITTVFGDSIKVVGSTAALGNWNPNSGIALNAGQYTENNPLWSLTTSMTAGASFEYKFIKVTESGDVEWEEGSNRQYTLPGGCGSSVTIDGNWQF